MSEDSIHTVLIPAQQWALRSRKGGGSVACTEQGGGSEVTCCQPIASVSYIWLRVCFLEDETQWGVNASRCHTVANVSSRCSCRSMCCLPLHPTSRRASNEEVNGVESQPNYNASFIRRNCGIVSAGVVEWFHSPAWRRSSNITQGQYLKWCGPRWPVMGPAVDQRSIDRIGERYKRPVMEAKARFSEGKWNSLCNPKKYERRNASAFRKNK